MLCGSEVGSPCVDSVLQEHWYDESNDSRYVYRKAGVLRWTSHETARHKMTRNPATTCRHTIDERADEFRWDGRSWSDPRWHPLSVATIRGRSESTSEVKRCYRD